MTVREEFHASNEPGDGSSCGWVCRGVLWLGQSITAALILAVPFVDSGWAWLGAILGSIASAVLLFRQVNGLIEQKQAGHADS